MMAHVQKPDFVFQRNRSVHLNQRGCQFSRLLAAEVCASAVVMLDTPCSKVVWRVLATHSVCQFPLHFPYRASPRAITFHLESTINLKPQGHWTVQLCVPIMVITVSVSEHIVKNKNAIIQLNRYINWSIIPLTGGTLHLLQWIATFASLFPQSDLLYMSLFPACRDWEKWLNIRTCWINVKIYLIKI
jgi:hypothetical protein